MRELPVYAVIPALDAEASISLVLDDLRELPTEIAEIIVVDNGSRDCTAEVARMGGATVLHEDEQGYGAACLAALRRIAKSEPILSGEDVIVVFLNADYSDYPEDLESLVQPIQEGDADFAVGSRLLYPDARAAVPFTSRVGSWIATRIIRARYGTRFSDLGPLRAITYSSLARLGMRDRTWGWMIEMQLRACREKLSIEEIPVRHRERRDGSSKISGALVGGRWAAVRILWVLARHLLGVR